MFRKFYPMAYVESVFEIDYERLYQKGYRGILFDIDNTLVPHGNNSTMEVVKLFQRIQAIGFQTILLSNNDKERIERFLNSPCDDRGNVILNQRIVCDYICDAGKPDVAGYRRALDRMGLKKRQVLCVGDQVFTDILGANRFGIDSILVEFIGAKTEKKLGIRRRVEKVILWFYKNEMRVRRQVYKIMERKQ